MYWAADIIISEASKVHSIVLTFNLLLQLNILKTSILAIYQHDYSSNVSFGLLQHGYFYVQHGLLQHYYNISIWIWPRVTYTCAERNFARNVPHLLDNLDLKTLTLIGCWLLYEVLWQLITYIVYVSHTRMNITLWTFAE